MDRGRIDITAFEDPYLVEYLHRQGYEEEVIQAYRWRSYPVDRLMVIIPVRRE